MCTDIVDLPQVGGYLEAACAECEYSLRGPHCDASTSTGWNHACCETRWTQTRPVCRQVGITVSSLSHPYLVSFPLNNILPLKIHGVFYILV